MFGFGTPDCDRCGGAYVGNPNPVLPLCYCSRKKDNKEEEQRKQERLEKKRREHLDWLEEQCRKERKERERKIAEAKMKSLWEELAEDVDDDEE